jgi:uncharacterized protein (DUF1015 family)
MATIRAFRAIRPEKDKAAAVAALPYDVYDRDEAREAVQGKPDTFLRVDRPETTMDPEIDLYDPAVYVQARKNLAALLERGCLLQDDAPCLYLYELTMNGRSQTGLVACTAVDDYLDGTIKKHEKTRSDKEADRIAHVDACDANTGPIYLTYRGQGAIDSMIAEAKAKAPVYDFTAEDGIIHRVWVIDDPQAITALTAAFDQVPCLYIADGHHRAASAVRVAQMRREAHPGYTGDEEFNYFLSVIFPAEQLHIMDYNRVVTDLNGLDTADFLTAVQKTFAVERGGSQPEVPARKGEFGMYLDGSWYKLTVKAGTFDAADPVASLDVAILQDLLLAPVLGIADPRTDKRIDFVGGIRGPQELVRRTEKDMRVAFLMYPTGIDELMAIADAGLLMPPKSTWFEPKLRSGLFIHKLS